VTLCPQQLRAARLLFGAMRAEEIDTQLHGLEVCCGRRAAAPALSSNGAAARRSAANAAASR